MAEPNQVSVQAAISKLKAEFPAFAEATEEIDLIDLEHGSSYRLSLGKASYHLDCQLYGWAWFLRLRNRPIQRTTGSVDPGEVDILVCQQPTLEDAIAALRQAAAEHLQALEVLR